MSVKIILPDDEYVKLLRKKMSMDEMCWDLLERDDIPLEFLEKIMKKSERYSNYFFNCVRESEVVNRLDNNDINKKRL